MFHIEMFLLKWLWQIEICKLHFAWRYLYIPEVWKFEFQQPVFKELTWVGLNSLWELKFKMGFHNSVKTIFSKHQNKIIFVIKLINSRSRMTLKSSVVIFWTLKTSAASLTSAASATSLASTASTALFPQKTSWSWWFDHQCHQNDQY